MSHFPASSGERWQTRRSKSRLLQVPCRVEAEIEGNEGEAGHAG